MRYTEFRDLIREELDRSPEGRTWAELRDGLGLPYDRPCPTWTRKLEEQIGLTRTKGAGRALVWKLGGRHATCICEGIHEDTLTYGRRYEVLEADEENRRIRLVDDEGDDGWYDACWFDLEGREVVPVTRVLLDDPIHDSEVDCIEVTVEFADGTARWCIVATARWIAAALENAAPVKSVDHGKLTIHRVCHYTERVCPEGEAEALVMSIPHLVVVSRMTEPVVRAAIDRLERQGELLESTIPFEGEESE
jgi:hypothetical protein